MKVIMLPLLSLALIAGYHLGNASCNKKISDAEWRIRDVVSERRVELIDDCENFLQFGFGSLEDGYFLHKPITDFKRELKIKDCEIVYFTSEDKDDKSTPYWRLTKDGWFDEDGNLIE